MKKRLTRIWGISLVVVMLITLLASAAPVSAGTLAFSKQTAVPSTTDKILQVNTNIADIAVNGDRIYAATNSDIEMVTATVTTTFVDGGDAAAEVYAVTYTDQDGVAGNAGVLTIPMNTVATTAIALTLVVVIPALSISLL